MPTKMGHLPVQLHHSPLVLSLCPLKYQLEILVLLFQYLYGLSRWSLHELCL